VVGKSSGKLLVYLQPSMKNQEEREPKRFAIALHQFRGVRCFRLRKYRVLPAQRIKGDRCTTRPRHKVLRPPTSSGVLLTGADLSSRLLSLLRSKMKHETHGDAAQRGKAEEKDEERMMRSEGRKRRKERNTERSRSSAIVTFCLGIVARSVAEQQQAHADRRGHNDRLVR